MVCGVKFGTTLLGVSLRDYPQVASLLERCGFESIWVPEHLVFPTSMPTTYPYSASGLPPVTPDSPSYDPWVVCGYLAAATERIRLGTNIYILPLRHPLQTARSVVTVDRVSGGRVTLGVGVGWLAEEFEYLGLSFGDRGRRADAAIAAVRRLWSEEVVEVHDGFFDFGPVKFYPKPLQRHGIPIEVGGSSPPALRRAGALGDGWIEVGCRDLAEFESKLAVVEAARREAGRTDPFEVTASATLARTVDDYRRLEDAGATRVIAMPRAMGARLSPAEMADWAKRFSDEVITRA
jgi:probable F420-dependent oxidoreductase